MKITKQRLKEIIREELAEAVLDYGKKPFGSPGTHLEETGAKPLPNTRVELRGDPKKKGYKTSRDLHGDKNYVMVKWDGVKGTSRVEKHLLDIIKE